MKQVEAWESSDGMIHRTQEAAIKREAEVTLRNGIAAYFERSRYSGEERSVLIDLLFKHMDGLAPLIEKYTKTLMQSERFVGDPI